MRLALGVIGGLLVLVGVMVATNTPLRRRGYINNWSLLSVFGGILFGWAVA